MKHFVLLFVVLSVGVMTQNQVHTLPEINVDEVKIIVTESKQKQLEQVNIINQPQQESTQNAKQIEVENNPQQKDQNIEGPKNQHHKKHQKRDHQKHDQFFDKKNHPHLMNEFRDQEFAQNPQRETYNFRFQEQSYDDEEQDPKPKHHKKFWKKKSVKHVGFWVILAVVSFFIVKKCVAKRNNHQRRRMNNAQQIANPVNVDQEINKHHAEIQRLQQIKRNIEAQRIQQQQQPIIYHEAFPQQVNMNNSMGRIVNENCYPRNMSQNLQMQNIPVGVPIVMGNPYNHPQIYKQY